MAIKEVIKLLSVSLIKSLLILTIEIKHSFTLFLREIWIDKLCMVKYVVAWAIDTEIVFHEHYLKLIQT